MMVTMRHQLLILNMGLGISLLGQAEVEDRLYGWMLSALLQDDAPRMDISVAASVPSYYLILDAREPEEYQVSHLRGAQHIGFDDRDLSALDTIDRLRPILVYCSVGYRSGIVAEELLDMGFEQVYNMYGGIFEWVNQGYPIIDREGQPTDRVHAYSRKWGVWLRKGEQVY